MLKIKFLSSPLINLENLKPSFENLDEKNDDKFYCQKRSKKKKKKKNLLLLMLF